MIKKIVGILVCMLVIITAFSAAATMNKQEKSSFNQSRGHSGGLFTQLPIDPGFSTWDWWAFASSTTWESGKIWQSYEMFSDVASPIQGIHWWGVSCKYNSFIPGDFVGMTFNITFYQDNNTKPGEIVLSYSNIKPFITGTGVLYPYTKPYELYFFEYDLTPNCNLSTGWVSIVSTGSDNNCSFFWMESSTGNHHAFYTRNGVHQNPPIRFGLSLVLADGVKTSLEIVKIKGGLGITLGIKNNGNTTVDNYPVDIIVKGTQKKINITTRKTISGLDAGITTSLKIGLFFGLEKITIFVVGDGIIAYKHGIQLFIFTIVQKT